MFHRQGIEPRSSAYQTDVINTTLQAKPTEIVGETDRLFTCYITKIILVRLPV